jgi:DnaJ-domain-containing protein 1
VFPNKSKKDSFIVSDSEEDIAEEEQETKELVKIKCIKIKNATIQVAKSITTIDEALTILQLQQMPDKDELKKAYHKGMLQNHPDKGGDVEKTKVVY